MKELSLHILDIAENSVKAGATLVRIEVTDDEKRRVIRVLDDGCGMTPEILAGVINPFYTTRTTRKVGLGVPLIKLAAEQTGGSLRIDSRHESLYPETHGTELEAVFFHRHVDCAPMGDIVATVRTLIQGHPDRDFLFVHTNGRDTVTLDTRQMREVLGEEIPLHTPEVLVWISESLDEQYAQFSFVQ